MPTHKVNSQAFPAPQGPMIAYSTYVGNNQSPAQGDVAVNSGGEVRFVIGPMITKLDHSGTVIYSRQDSGWIDAQRNCYVVGRGKITPTPGAAFQAQPGSQQFVMKVDGTGGTVYATYLGGSGSDGTSRIVVDSSGDLYVGGATNSNDFPTAHAFRSTLSGGGDGCAEGIWSPYPRGWDGQMKLSSLLCVAKDRR